RMLEKTQSMIKESKEHIKDLAIGGTAVGTGLNTHPDFPEKVCSHISQITGKAFRSEPVKFHSLTRYYEVLYAHGSLKALAADLMKIATDVRRMASGPRSGTGEFTITSNEPGRSIMPGKVNPTQCEAVTMVSTQVMGNDAAVGFAASQGNFELNVFNPVIAYNFLQSAQILSDSMLSFEERCVRGIEPNQEKIDQFLR